MAVTSSPPISLVADIVEEFGGSTPYSLTDYYRGGDLVPDTTVNENAGVPTTGNPISLTDFYGASASGGATSDTLTLTSDTFSVFRGFSLFAKESDLEPDTLSFTSFSVTIINLYYNTSAGTLVFEVNTNSGNGDIWTSMQLGSNTFTKDSATYDLRAGTASQWTWDSSDGVDNNTMPSSGTISVIFTE